METVEQYCRILILAAQIGDWNQMSANQVMDLLKIREKLGQTDRRVIQKCDPCSLGVPGESLPGSSQTPSNGSSCSAPSSDLALIEEVTRRVVERLGKMR